MKNIVHLSLVLATMSLAQQLPRVVDTAPRPPSSEEAAPPRIEADQAPAEGEEAQKPPRITLELGAQTTSVAGK